MTAPTITDRAEVIVVGLGAMGSATAFQLAMRGVSVIGIDRFHPPHPFGSTHGDTRITRLSVGEGAEYVPLVARAHELWPEIEREAGVRVMTRCGGLILAEPGSRFLEATIALAERFGIEHERLAIADLRARFGMFAVGDTTEAYYEPSAGHLRPEAAVEAQLGLARRLGARLRFGECVDSWEASSNGVRVTTSAGSYDAEQLILCAGPWLPELFAEGRDLFAVYRQLLFWFPIRQGLAQLAEMPIFVWEFGGDVSGFVHLDCFYGFPAIDGAAGGMKIGTESFATATTADGQQHPATETESAHVYATYVQERLPWLGAAPLRTVSCLYTSTRGCRFVIDRHPAHDAVTIVSACSGHGFKHSPAIGEAVARSITGAPARPGIDLEPFRIASGNALR